MHGNTTQLNNGRRRCLSRLLRLMRLFGVLWLSAGRGRPAMALMPEQSQRLQTARLDASQTRLFRAWLVCIVNAQLQQMPTPRWVQRDCAGLVRFAVAEALRDHDLNWQRANGLLHVPLPPEISLTGAQRALRHQWYLSDGSTSAYVSALELIQENSRFVSKDWNLAEPGDLLFYDQGDNQHLMIWMGRFVAYHTGSQSARDHGLRVVTIQQLLTWKDTRWQPSYHNPNFLGIYRLAFLSP